MLATRSEQIKGRCCALSSFVRSMSEFNERWWKGFKRAGEEVWVSDGHNFGI